MHNRESFVNAQATRQEPDMTGIWRGNDGSVYYIRHDDPHVWWAGFSDNGSGHNWTNVLEGEVTYDPTGAVEVSGQWYDVPRGTNRGSGILGFSVRLGDLVKTYQSSGFGANILRKIS